MVQRLGGNGIICLRPYMLSRPYLTVLPREVLESAKGNVPNAIIVFKPDMNNSDEVYCECMLSTIVYCFQCKFYAIKLQFLVIMLHAYGPKYDDKADTDKWVYNMRELFQTRNALLISLLQVVPFIKHLQSLLLLSLINIDQLVPPAKHPIISQFMMMQ